VIKRSGLAAPLKLIGRKIISDILLSDNEHARGCVAWETHGADIRHRFVAVGAANACAIQPDNLRNIYQGSGGEGTLVGETTILPVPDQTTQPGKRPGWVFSFWRAVFVMGGPALAREAVASRHRARLARGARCESSEQPTTLPSPSFAPMGWTHQKNASRNKSLDNAGVTGAKVVAVRAVGSWRGSGWRAAGRWRLGG
jgi:hypothetical protein